MKRRIGKFYWCFPRSRFDRPDGWKIYLPLFAQLVVLRCEHMFASDKFEVIALSDLFDEVEAGTEPPIYDLTYDTSGEIPGVRAYRQMKP